MRKFLNISIRGAICSKNYQTGGFSYVSSEKPATAVGNFCAFSRSTIVDQHGIHRLYICQKQLDFPVERSGYSEAAACGP
jgi:hypothetical protein